MINTLEAFEEIITLLIQGGVKTAISGVVDVIRPINSEKEDVIVGTLPLTFDQLQDCTVNINIHVPNLKIKKNGIDTNDTPDRPRLKALLNIVYPSLNEKKTSKIYTTILNS